jgi:hypothetical protein
VPRVFIIVVVSIITTIVLQLVELLMSTLDTDMIGITLVDGIVLADAITVAKLGPGGFDRADGPGDALQGDDETVVQLNEAIPELGRLLD